MAVFAATFLIVLSPVKSQEPTENEATDKVSFEDLFAQAGNQLNNKNYSQALTSYLKLNSIQSGNANIAYRIGLCYLYSSSDKIKAISYLEKAIKNATKNYDDRSHTEVNAPLKAYYALASAYHVNYQLDTAISTYKTYLGVALKKQHTPENITRQIEMCEYAKFQTASPINVEIQNLGDNINSKYSDFCPVISADETTLIFTSRREGGTSSASANDGEYFQDIYISYQDMGSWIHAVGVGPSINTNKHDAAVGLSADGQLLFIYKDDEGDGNIYQSNLIGDTWSVPVKLSENINSSSNETHASVSSDGNVLYFVSDRPGGFGGTDIYRCRKLPNGEWAIAENVGDNINTSSDEVAPCLHPNGTLLFFSSTGHKSMGGFDILFSELMQDGSWIDPLNIGYPINTVQDDIFYVPSSDGKRAYYSSVDNSGFGNHDIYTAVFKDFEEIALTVLKGIMYITDAEGEVMESSIIVYDNSDMDAAPKLFKPNSTTGKYIIVLAPDRDYTIFYTVEDSILQTEHIFIPEESAYQEIEKTIGLKPVELLNFNINEPPAVEEKVIRPPVETKAIVEASPEKVIEEVTTENELKKSSGTIIKDVASYRCFFNYNIRFIDRGDKRYQQFLKSVALLVKQNGSANFVVAGSASKVPTQTFGNNESLASKRAEAAKEILMASLKELNMNIGNIHIEVKSLVQGPEYSNDAVGNRQLYEKYQYVEIQVK